jgi:hypothetical protein
LLWCAHVTHHSSDHFNLTNGFRTSPFQGLFRIPFWIILPIVGFSPEVLLVTFIVSGLYDFFLHTQHFPKVRWLETVLITPSLHKVHHGKNDVYIDKNYGATFVIWDKLFGTFQDEIVPVSYGILSEDYRDGDPVDAIFHHYRYLWVLMQQSVSWKSKLKVLIMPPDWLPEDLSGPADLPVITFPAPSHRQVVYAIVQFALSALGIITILLCEARFPVLDFSLYAAFFLACMISATRILNRRVGLHFNRNEFMWNASFAAAFALFFLGLHRHSTDLLVGLAIAIVYTAWSLILWVSDKKRAAS